MKIEGLSHNKIEKKDVYSMHLEKLLGLSDTIDKIEKDFDEFNNTEQKENIHRDELDTLRAIKIFLYRNENKIREVARDSKLPGFDCLSMCVITCLLAHRKGYEVTIGRPDKISRYLHALIIMSDGNMFKIAGKSRNYDVKKMTVEEVMKRLKYTGPIINIIDSLKLKT